MDEKAIARFWSKVDRAGSVPAHMPHLGPCWLWKASKYPTGYGRFYRDGERRGTGAHRIAFEIAIGPVPEGLYVMHLCDNRSCVRPEHLAAGTAQQNINDMIEKGRKGRSPRGEEQGHAKINAAIVSEMRRLHSDRVRCVDIAMQFGVSASAVRQIVRGTSWKHVPAPVSAARGRATTHLGEKHPLAKLNPAKVREIRALADAGLPLQRIADRFGVARNAIRSILSGKSWAHVA